MTGQDCTTCKFLSRSPLDYPCAGCHGFNSYMASPSLMMRSYFEPRTSTKYDPNDFNCQIKIYTELSKKENKMSNNNNMPIWLAEALLGKEAVANIAMSGLPTITDVIFNDPATIVFWSDGTKTVVKCDHNYEAYDPEKGMAMAISKKMLGGKYDYYNVFKHYRKNYEKQIAVNASNIAEDVNMTPTNI